MKKTSLLFLKALCFSTTLFFYSCGGDQEKSTTATGNEVKVYVRKNANSPEAKADLEAMQIALQKMRQLDCSNPSSWYYQGSIHWIPDTVLNGNPYCPSYTNARQLKLAWDNCTHTSSSSSGFNFLIWHRFYILYFEQLVRDLSGYKDFALPYWDYTDTINIRINRTMPLPLRTTGNSLYEQARFDSINSGCMISGQPITDQLDITNLMENKLYQIFNKNINVAPHGAMHNYIGGGNSGQTMWNPIYQDTITEGGGLMANVPSAGYDPIFWLHHSNIDRLWQLWTDMDPARHKVDSLLVIRNQWPYVFFNAQGDTIQYTMEEVAAQMYKMNYVYDNQQPVTKTPLLATTPLGLEGDTLHKIKVGKKLTRLPVVQSILVSKAKTLNLTTTKEETGKRIILMVNASFIKEPKGAYQVYINLPNGAKPDVKSKYFAGFMNFFGAAHHAGHTETNKKPTKTVQTSFEFDVTDEFIEGKIQNLDKVNVSIFRSSGGLANDEITIESIVLYTF